VVRRERVTHVIRDGDGALFKENSRTDNQFTIKQEERPVRGRNGEVSEVQNVIDLTLSDSDSDSGSEEYHRSMSDPVATITRPDVTTEPSPSPLSPTSVPISAYDRKALLTPIATVLKSDRLGIGLKAKTVGPYKASQKRVTHNAAALAAHIRNAEEQRKKRMEVGRGRGGFEKLNKREETKRKRMLAYLNE
jgi:hypothetical protein